MPVPKARLNPAGNSRRNLMPKTNSTPTNPKSAPEAPADGTSADLKRNLPIEPTPSPGLTVKKLANTPAIPVTTQNTTNLADPYNFSTYGPTIHRLYMLTSRCGRVT